MEYWKEDRCSDPSAPGGSVVGATAVNYREDRSGNQQGEDKQLWVDEDLDEEAPEERSGTEHEDDGEGRSDFSVREYRALIESIRIATKPIILSKADPKRHFVMGVTAAAIGERPVSTDGSLASFYIALLQRTYSAFMAASRRERRRVAQEQVVKPLILQGGCCAFYERPKKHSSCQEVLQPLADIVKIENRVIRDFQRMGRLKSPPQEHKQEEALKNDSTQLCAAADELMLEKAKDDDDYSGSVASIELTSIRNRSLSKQKQQSPILPAEWQRTPQGYGGVPNLPDMAENHAKAFGAPKVPDQHVQTTELTSVMGNNDQNQEKKAKSVVEKSSYSHSPPQLNPRQSDAAASWQVVSSILSNEHTAIAASPSCLTGAVLKTNLPAPNQKMAHFPYSCSDSSPSKRKLPPSSISELGAMGIPVLEPFAKSKKNYLPDGYKSNRGQFVTNGAISGGGSIGGHSSTDSNANGKKQGGDQDMDTKTEELRASSEQGQDLNRTKMLLGVLSTRFADIEERLSDMESKNCRLKQRLLHLEEAHKTHVEMCQKRGSN